VFVFHDVAVEEFELQMKYLAENNYTPISSEELYSVISGEIEYRDKSVVLTFDDGRRSLWTTAYPLLKKYGFPAIAFVSPYLVPEDRDSNRYQESSSLCSWPELQEMAASGHLDIQSHTCFHHSVFTDNRPINFVSPNMQTSFLHSDLFMMTRKNGEDLIQENPEWGTPLYAWAPAMSSNRRFIEDENISEQCIAFVAQQGGQQFFREKGWRRRLYRNYLEHRERSETSGYFQTKEERYQEIRQDLLNSKERIEEKLNNHVTHLCYPWFKGSEMAIKASKAVGYEVNYWGILANRSLNYPGGDPYHIARISGRYILALPGKNRRSFFKLIRGRYN
jgi:peptidoglycan/xylan/chitin deacetylase (PgdA/CDA1 family)